MKPDCDLDTKITGFVRRKRCFFAGRAMTLIGVFCLVLAFLLVTTDVIVMLPAWARWGAFAVLICTAVLAFVHDFLLPVFRLDSRGAVREIEHGHREFGQMLRTSDQLRRQIEVDATGFSPALVRALEDEARRALAEVDPNRLIPWRWLLRGGVLLGLLVIAFGAALLVWHDFRTGVKRLLLPAAELTYTQVVANPNATQFERGESIDIQAKVSGRHAEEAVLNVCETDGVWEAVQMTAQAPGNFEATLAGRVRSYEFFVQAGDGRSDIQRIRFIDPPVIEQVSIRLLYPEYTGLEPEEMDGGDAVAVEGTRVVYQFRLNHPLREAVLRVGEEYAVTAERHGENVTAAWDVLVGDTEVHLEGVDHEDLRLRKSVYQLRGLADKLPRVELLLPKQDVETTAVGEFPVTARFRDDYGIEEAGIVFTLDGRKELLRARHTGRELVFLLRQSTLALLENYPVRPGSNVKLFAYARDRKPRSEARGVSELRGIDIRPFKIRYQPKPPMGGAPLTAEEMREQRDHLKELEKAIEEQRDVLSKTFKLQEEKSQDRKTPDKLAKKEDALARKMNALQQEMAELMAEDENKPLDDAASEMDRAAADLREAQLDTAFKKEDNALSHMLEMHKEALKQLAAAEAAQTSEPQEQEAEAKEEARELLDLAQEAERLAREEKSVREKLTAAQQDQAQQDQAQQDQAQQDQAQQDQAQQDQAQQDQAQQDQAQQDQAQQDQAQQDQAQQDQAQQDQAQQDQAQQDQAQQDQAQQDQAQQDQAQQDQAQQDQAQQDQAQQDQAQQDQAQQDQAQQDQAQQDQAQQDQAQQDQAQQDQAQQDQAQQDQAQQDQAQQDQARQDREQAQQDAAVEDAATLREQIETQPEATPLAERRMAEAEKTMQEAAEHMRSEDTAAAEQELAAAEQRLSQLAEHLRGLADERLADTLKAASEKAEQAAEQLAQSSAPQAPADADAPAPAEGQAPAQKPGESSAPAAEGKGSPKPTDQAAAAEPESGSESPSRPEGSDADKAPAQEAAAGEQGQPKTEQEQAQSDAQAEGQEPGSEQQQQAAGQQPAEGEKQAQGQGPAQAQTREPTDEANASARESIAQDAETIADWLRQIERRELPGLENMQERLGDTREELAVDQLAQDVRQASGQRNQGQQREAEQLEREAADRFQQLAETLAKERQRVIQGQLERLAAAEAEAQALKTDVEGQPQDEPGQPQAQPAQQPARAQTPKAQGMGGEEKLPERLRNLGEELRDLKDQELEQLGDQLMEQVGPQNISGRPVTGQVVPKEIADNTLAPTVLRLRSLIDEIVQQELLLNRDERVPDKYTGLVERYFKALSDDLPD